MGAIFGLVSVIVERLPGMISAGMEVYDIIEKTQAVVDENKVVGDAEWEALDASVKKHKAEFEAAAKD